MHSNHPIERVNGEIKRRTEVVGIFSNEDTLTRLVGAIPLEQNDDVIRPLSIRIDFAQGRTDEDRGPGARNS